MFLENVEGKGGVGGGGRSGGGGGIDGSGREGECDHVGREGWDGVFKGKGGGGGGRKGRIIKGMSMRAADRGGVVVVDGGHERREGKEVCGC